MDLRSAQPHRDRIRWGHQHCVNTAQRVNRLGIISGVERLWIWIPDLVRPLLWFAREMLPHRLMCLNSWLPAGGAIVKPSEDRALLRKCATKSRPWGFGAHSSISSLCSPWEKSAACRAFLPEAILVKMTMLNLCEDRVQSWKVISYIGHCHELLETETSAILLPLLGNLNASLETRVRTLKAQKQGRLSCTKLPVCSLPMQLWCLPQSRL